MVLPGKYGGRELEGGGISPSPYSSPVKGEEFWWDCFGTAVPRNDVRGACLAMTKEDMPCGNNKGGKVSLSYRRVHNLYLKSLS